MTRDQSLMPDDQEEPRIEEIRAAQKVVGEVLWSVTRSRPDIMFAASRMGASVLKGTNSVMTAAQHLKEYLWQTRAQGLIYEEEEETEIFVQVFTDASYAPNSEESQRPARRLGDLVEVRSSVDHHPLHGRGRIE